MGGEGSVQLPIALMAESTPTTPPISVVVIGRNEGQRLTRCLESVRAADYPADVVQLIYVDTDSTDDSCERAQRLGATVVQIHPERPSAAAGRNAGLRAATSELVQFLDGDTILDRGWLKKAVGALRDSTLAGVFGRREEMAKDATIYNFWAHHDWYGSPGPAASCGGDVLFRKSALDAVGGYDESLIAGEEMDLCHRIRAKTGLGMYAVDASMTLHDMNMTRWRQYWRRCVRTGHAYAEVGGRYADLHRWRRARWRNLAYALATPVAVVASLAAWSPWPVVVWIALVGAAWIRNAWRMRSRLGSLGDALRYSASHYLAKTPTAIGQCSYWFRTAFKKPPQRLIEYRT